MDLFDKCYNFTEAKAAIAAGIASKEERLTEIMQEIQDLIASETDEQDSTMV